VTLRAAIVGAGLMGGWHARYARRTGARIVAVVDTDGQRAERLAGRFPGADSYDDLAACLGGANIDVVHVCTDSSSHLQLAAAALRAGCHVLVEKPAAISRSDALELLGLAQMAGRLLCPVHQLPFQAGFRRLQSRLERLGPLVRVTHRLASAGGGELSQERRLEVLREVTPHSVSLLRSLVGARCDVGQFQVLHATPDDLVLFAEDDGLCSSVELSLRARPTRHVLAVVGETASARVDLFHGFATFARGRTSRRGKLAAPFVSGFALLSEASLGLLARTLRWEPAYPGLAALIRSFYGAVREGRSDSPVGTDELLASVALLERVRAAQSQ